MDPRATTLLGLCGPLLAGATRSPQDASSASWPILADAAAAGCHLVLDQLAWQRVWRQERTDEPPPPVDFGVHAVVAVVRPLPAGKRLAWRGPLPGPAVDGGDGDRDAGADALHVLVAAVPVPDAAPDAPPHRGAFFVVPRPDRALVVHWREGGHDTAIGRVPAPPAIGAGERIEVLGLRDFDDRGTGPLRCERASTLAELRALRATFGLSAADLPDDAARFPAECLVVLHTERARVFAGFGVDVASEEGVDVITLAQSAPSGRDPGLRAPTIVLRLPRRDRTLAVVLRSTWGPSPPGERTVATFAPLPR